jgi:flagellar basal body P-ring protein FlgI
MNQATLVIVCAAMWLLTMATSQAQQKPSAAKAPAGASAPAKPAPAKAAPSQPAVKPAVAAPVPSQPAAKLPAAAKAGDTVLRALALLDGQQKGPTVGDICEVKHYQIGNLYGFGLVLNLKAVAANKASGGEENDSTAADVAKLVDLLNLLNYPIGNEDSQKAIVEKLQGADQLTVVAVTADVPPEGLRQGDRVDCQVKGVDGASLESGYLLATRLSTLGPAKEANVAIAAGPIDSETHRTSGPRSVVGGCLVESDICDQFTQDNKITLVLGEEHAEFSIAQDVVDLINLQMGTADQPVAKALNRFNIEVSVPAQYEQDPVAFVTQILKLPAPIAITEESED